MCNMFYLHLMTVYYNKANHIVFFSWTFTSTVRSLAFGPDM